MQAEQEGGRTEVAQGGGLDVVLNIWRRRKWLAIFIFVEVFTAITSVIMFLPNIYESTATILVERQQVPEAFVKATVTGSLNIRLQTITQEVLSRSRIEGLINRFDLYPDLRQRVRLEEVIATMRRNIRVSQKGTQHSGDDATVAFTVSYHGKNPQQVAQVTDTIASFYINENLKARERQASGTAEFLGSQLTEVKQKLEEQEKRLSEFKERYMGELPEQLASNLAILERLNTQIRLNGEKLARSSEQRAVLAKQWPELDDFTRSRKTRVERPSDTKPDLNTQRLATLHQELAALQARFNENYPDIISLKSEIAALERQSTTMDNSEPQSQETEAMLNPYVQQWKKEFASLDIEIKAIHYEEQNLLSSIQLYQQRVENTPRRDQELQLILRDYEAARSRYQSLLKRNEEAKLAENLEQRQKGEQFRLLESALPGKRPVRPNRRKSIFMGFCFALGLAGGSVILAERLHPAFHSAKELEAFSHIPVLVSLPCIVTQADSQQRRWRFSLAVIAAIVMLGLSLAGSYLLIKKPAMLSKSYVQLRTLSAQEVRPG